MGEDMSFKCVGDEKEEIPSSIIENGCFTFPDVHTKAQDIAALASEIKSYKNNSLCMLPFCNTVEAEALGGKIKLGNYKNGPRVEAYTFNCIEEAKGFKEIDLSHGRINEVLKAVEILNEQNEIVSLNVEGPFTVATSLMDSTVFYKAIRKNTSEVYEFMEVIENSIVKYIKEGIKRGAKIISYGDPVGALDIVGPKIYREFSSKYTYNILKAVEKIDEGLVHLCGKTSKTFEKMDLLHGEPIKFKEGLTYGECINYVIKERKDIRFIGHNCIKRTPYKLNNSILWALKLK